MRNVPFLIACLVLCVGICSAFVYMPNLKKTEEKHLLGAKECTWGPSYWCSNLTNAARCKAVPHCIQTVWIHQNPSPDTDSVCQICVKMVGEARDQLESNETQEELKQVFDGSCNLIPLKTISKECCKLVDEFIPELVETLASQMNPQVVCSVAGLCNNAHIDELLAQQAIKITEPKMKSESQMDLSDTNTCDECHTVMNIIEKKFNNSSKSDLLHGFLEVCAHLGSFSDSCSNIVINYFPEIYNHLKLNLNGEEVCIMSGECYAKFHVHVDVKPLSNSGFIPVGKENDDLPCKLCEQLVGHLRDLLIANTTELEFQKVLEGVCKQMKEFKQECLSIADQYYPQVYNFLISELNSTAVCAMIGICPNSKDQKLIPVAPLLLKSPSDAEATKIQNLMSDSKPKLARVPLEKSESTVRISESTRLTNLEKVPLPIERISPKTLTLMGNTELCSLCEYFLHYVQQAITDASTDAEIKNVIYNKVCNRLPKTLNGSCHDFVDTYGDAMIAILAQKMDPSIVCPTLSLCKSAGQHDIELIIKEFGIVNDKPNCPLCLFAIDELENVVKQNKTQDNIKNALSRLCSHLSKNLAAECNDFVNTYTNELVDLLMNDFTPQEVCVYLKICNDTKLQEPDDTIVIEYGGRVETNEIPDKTVNGKTLISAELINNEQSGAKPQCIICEFVMSQIENELQDNKTDEAIEHAVLNVCKLLPKTVKKECNQFIKDHGDQVIQLLVSTLDPQKVCGFIGMCGPALKDLHLEVEGCAVCEAAVSALDKLLQNPNVDHKLEHLFEKACKALPKDNRNQCKNLIDTYGDAIFNELVHLSDPSEICSTIGVCSQHAIRHSLRFERDVLVGQNPCTHGPSHWCASHANAKDCKSVEYCKNRVWKQQPPPPGSNDCTWGPSHWCSSPSKAEECNSTNYCQEHAWKHKPVGTHECTWGPSHWCANSDNANKCGATEFCKTYTSSTKN